MAKLAHSPHQNLDLQGGCNGDPESRMPVGHWPSVFYATLTMKYPPTVICGNVSIFLSRLTWDIVQGMWVSLTRLFYIPYQVSTFPSLFSSFPFCLPSVRPKELCHVIGMCDIPQWCIWGSAFFLTTPLHIVRRQTWISLRYSPWSVLWPSK